MTSRLVDIITFAFCCCAIPLGSLLICRPLVAHSLGTMHFSQARLLDGLIQPATPLHSFAQFISAGRKQCQKEKVTGRDCPAKKSRSLGYWLSHCSSLIWRVIGSSSFGNGIVLLLLLGCSLIRTSVFSTMGERVLVKSMRRWRDMIWFAMRSHVFAQHSIA